MLARSKDYLSYDGLVYVEVPDGEMAEAEGSGMSKLTERERWIAEQAYLAGQAAMACALGVGGQYHPSDPGKWLNSVIGEGAVEQGGYPAETSTIQEMLAEKAPNPTRIDYFDIQAEEQGAGIDDADSA